MKRILSMLLIAVLALTAVPALAANDAGTNYTLSTEGVVVLQDIADRNITPAAGALDVNPVIEGRSPTTGMPVSGDSLYMPMLVQISNPEGSVKVDGKNVTAAGIGQRAPWGGQYADIVYEGILYRSGQTRITFLFNDSFAEGQPLSVGPVRSARIGHVLLREEWQGGIVYAGGPRREENNIAAMFAELGASDKGVTFNLLDGKYQEYKNRVSGVKAPDNYNVNLVGIRSLVPATTVAVEHPFLFAEASPYVDGYEVAGCANTGSVSGADAVGGIVGHTSASEEENANVRVTGCTNSGAVSGNSAVGGIVGDHSSDYAASDVHTAATVQGCVNTGTVPAGGGAIVGNNNVKEGKPGKVESCFWPQEQGGAVGTGAGSAGQPSDAVKNNSSYDGTGRLNTPVEVNGETKHDLAGALAGAVGGGSAANVPDALKVTVRFDANGHGTAPDAKQVVLGTQLVLPDMADADGHAFAGWQQGGRTYKAGEVCGIMADTVFTAQWNSGTQGGAGNTPATAQKPNPQTGL